MEQNFQSTPKIFWRFKRGKQNPVHLVFILEGVLLTSNESIVGRWKEYFKDLPSPTKTHSEEEAELEGFGPDSLITLPRLSNNSAVPAPGGWMGSVPSS